MLGILMAIMIIVGMINGYAGLVNHNLSFN